MTCNLKPWEKFVGIFFIIQMTIASPPSSFAVDSVLLLKARKDAEKLLEDANREIVEAEKKFGPDHVEVAKVLEKAGNMHEQLGNFQKAEELCKRSLAIKEKTFGLNDVEVSNTEIWLAEIYERQGKYTEAARLYERRLEILQQKTHGTRGSHDIGDGMILSSDLMKLASLYVPLRRYSEAEALYQQALAISQEVLPTAPEVVTYRGLYGLALLYESEHRYAEAELLYQRVVSILEAHPSAPTDFELTEILKKYAALLRNVGKFEQAGLMEKRAKVVDQRLHGK